MRSDALQLARQYSNNLRAFGYFYLQQLLDRHHVRQIVAQRIEVIHAVSDDDALLILSILKEFLHARVEITNVGRALHHHLAVEHEFQTQHAMGRRMLRSHRDRHLRVERAIDDLELLRNGADFGFRISDFGFQKINSLRLTVRIAIAPSIRNSQSEIRNHSRLYGSYPRNGKSFRKA